MYLAHVTLFFVLCVISEQTTFEKGGQGVTDITVHTIPGGTTLVKFNNNLISFVPPNYFINLPSLDEIWFGQNVITNITDSAFAQVPTVTIIHLQYNQLTGIREMMFSGLPNLSELRLAFNQIHTIEPSSFKDNTALTRLTLSSNSLQNLPQCMTFEFDNHPANLDQFYIGDNPLQCGQDLCWLKQLDTTWITVQPSLPECAEPTALAGRTWDTLSEQDLCDTSVAVSVGRWSLEGQDKEITSGEKAMVVKTLSRLACSAECKMIRCKDFSYNKLGDGQDGECRLNTNPCGVSLNSQNGAGYYSSKP